MKKTFLESLKERVIVCDGGMGTMLYQKGTFITKCFEELNISNPKLVVDVHKEFVEAGADLIETNTFGANFIKLKKFGLEKRLKDIILAGIDLAHEAAGQKAWVGGAIGPLGFQAEAKGNFTSAQIAQHFGDVVDILDEGKVDVLIFETFPSLSSLCVAINAAQKISKLPKIAQLTINEEGMSLAGDSPEAIAKAMNALDVQVIGFNCSMGPKITFDAVTGLLAHTSRHVSAQPNAGLPQLVDDRIIYLTSPEYFGVYAKRFVKAGVRLVGGCCGTTPDHIRMIKQAVLAFSPRIAELPDPVINEERDRDANIVVVETRHKSKLAQKIFEKRFVISVELDPPKGTIVEPLLQKARELQENGVDVINIADGPRASSRMSPLALALSIQNQLHMETIPHYCCRDRNILGLQSDLLGASTLGIKNIVVITGDPPRMGDHPQATAVYDLDSIGLVGVVNRLNHGIDIGGNPMTSNTSFFIGVGANPGAINIDEEVRRLSLKIKNGAEYIMTQPVYEPELLKRFLEKVEGIRIPILVGILPLSGYRNAEFLHNEVPGMEVPESIRAKLKEAKTIKEEKKIGIEIAQNAFRECRDLVQGVYIMPPFNNVAAALKIILM